MNMRAAEGRYAGAPEWRADFGRAGPRRWPTRYGTYEDRGRMFVSPAIVLYKLGMVIGIHSRDNDLVVNPIKGKQLTNVRASGTDEAVALGTRFKLTLNPRSSSSRDDELVEITPKCIRIRKALPARA